MPTRAIQGAGYSPEPSPLLRVLPANKHIISEALFSRFQDIYSGCCTVAAQRARCAELEPRTLWYVVHPAQDKPQERRDHTRGDLLFLFGVLKQRST